MGLWCVRNSDVLHEEVRDVHHKYHYESVHLARIVEGAVCSELTHEDSPAGRDLTTHPLSRRQCCCRGHDGQPERHADEHHLEEGQQSAAAQGRFVHVLVDRENRRPTPIREEMRTALSRLLFR